MKRIIWTIAALAFAGPAVGVSGRLVDQDGRPVPQAWVIATREECKGLAHCSTRCVEVKVAKTDALGNYSFDSGLRRQDAYLLQAYHEGYVSSYRHVGM